MTWFYKSSTQRMERLDPQEIFWTKWCDCSNVVVKHNKTTPASCFTSKMQQQVKRFGDVIDVKLLQWSILILKSHTKQCGPNKTCSELKRLTQMFVLYATQTLKINYTCLLLIILHMCIESDELNSFYKFSNVVLTYFYKKVITQRMISISGYFMVSQKWIYTTTPLTYFQVRASAPFTREDVNVIEKQAFVYVFDNAFKQNPS